MRIRGRTDLTSPVVLRQRGRQRPAVGSFSPNRPVMFVSQDRITLLRPEQIRASRVGWKSFGLSCLPSEWVPPFFVVDGAAAGGLNRKTLEANLSLSIAKLKLEHQDVIVRSSGVAETIEQRGQLISRRCASGQILATLRQLSSELQERKLERVHFVVQEYVQSSR